MNTDLRVSNTYYILKVLQCSMHGKKESKNVYRFFVEGRKTMGFLFFTILLLPAILLYGLIVVSLGWAASHMMLVNTFVGVLLALNLLFLGLLIRRRFRRGKNGQRKASTFRQANFHSKRRLQLY